jgi:hypothetical protein
MRRLLTGALCLVVATTAIVVGVSSTAWAAAENQIITFSHRCAVINDDGRTEGVICADIQFRLTTDSVQARSAGQGVCQDWGGGTTRQCRGISYDVGLFRDSGNATQLTSANGRCGYFGGSACPASGRLIVYTPWYTIGSKPPPPSLSSPTCGRPCVTTRSGSSRRAARSPAPTSHRRMPIRSAGPPTAPGPSPSQRGSLSGTRPDHRGPRL